MAKVEVKKQYILDGGIYDHETRTFSVETKDGCLTKTLDEIFEQLDGYEIKLTATLHLEED